MVRFSLSCKSHCIRLLAFFCFLVFFCTLRSLTLFIAISSRRTNAQVTRANNTQLWKHKQSQLSEDIQVPSKSYFEFDCRAQPVESAEHTSFCLKPISMYEQASTAFIQSYTNLLLVHGLKSLICLIVVSTFVSSCVKVSYKFYRFTLVFS